MSTTLEDVLKQARELGEMINAPVELVDFYAGTLHYGDDGFYINLTQQGIMIEYRERGSTQSRTIYDTPNESLYNMFRGITSNMARQYELINRNENQDFRRIMFAHQLSLLGQINPVWEDKRRKEIDKILNDAPYEDDIRSEG